MLHRENDLQREESACAQDFLWAVVGGGPCGIIATALLVEHLKQHQQDDLRSSTSEIDGKTQAHQPRIAWIDPEFRVGNLARWQDVQANSSVEAICSSFASLPTLRFQATQQARSKRGVRTLVDLLQPKEDSGTIEPNDLFKKKRKSWCELGLVVDALEDATVSLLQDDHVVGIAGKVVRVEATTQSSTSTIGQPWRVEICEPRHLDTSNEVEDDIAMESQRGLLASLRKSQTETDDPVDAKSLALGLIGPILTRSVVFATGAAPKAVPLRLQDAVHVIGLESALVSARLRALLRWAPPPRLQGPGESGATVPWQCLRWTIVGSSHSAMLALRNLIGLGVQKVQIVHRRPLLYVERCTAPGKDQWLKNLGRGLVGPTGAWCRKELPLLEDGRVVWKCFPEGDMTDPHIGKDNDDWEDWVLKNSDVLIFAAGFEPAPLPGICNAGRGGEGGSNTGMTACASKASRSSAAASRCRSEKSRSPRRERPLAFSADPASQSDSSPELPAGLFGLGIAFPERHKEPDGDVDIRVGFVRHYIEYAAQALGLGTDWLVFQE